MSVFSEAVTFAAYLQCPPHGSFEHFSVDVWVCLGQFINGDFYTHSCYVYACIIYCISIGVIKSYSHWEAIWWQKHTVNHPWLPLKHIKTYLRLCSTVWAKRPSVKVISLVLLLQRWRKQWQRRARLSYFCRHRHRTADVTKVDITAPCDFCKYCNLYPAALFDQNVRNDCFKQKQGVRGSHDAPVYVCCRITLTLVLQLFIPLSCNIFWLLIRGNINCGHHTKTATHSRSCLLFKGFIKLSSFRFKLIHRV